MNQGGFSLIEVLVATAMVVILLTVSAGVTMFGFSVSERTEISDTALSLAQIRIEEVMAQGFDTIQDTPDLGVVDVQVAGFENEYEESIVVTEVYVQDDPVEPALKRISITVSTKNPPYLKETLTAAVAK